MVLAFAPLFLAVATYTRFALQQVEASAAEMIGRAAARPIFEKLRTHTRLELESELAAELAQDGNVGAVIVIGPGNRALGRAGDGRLLEDLGQELERQGFGGESGSPFTLPSAAGRVWAVVLAPERPQADDVGAQHHRVALALRLGVSASGAAPVVRLVGLYTAVMALALLVLTYFAMTRLIVRPLGSLAQAAGRVAGGARHFDVPEVATPELVELAQSFRTMTERLLEEESALRSKIDEVETKTRELKIAQSEIVRSERLASAGKLAVGLTHEIGNPIAALIGFQDLLLEGGLSTEEQHDFIGRMRRETDRIHRILQDLLQFARPATRGEHALDEPGDVEAAVYDTVALVNPQKALTDIELGVDIFPDLPSVTLSRAELTQVLLNLVLNAASATGQAGHVRLSARFVDGSVRLSVEDSGPGVPEALRDQIFEPFMTTKPPGEGTGLGLAVCRSLVEAAGGRIYVDPAFAEGARFVVELPAARTPSDRRVVVPAPKVE